MVVVGGAVLAATKSARATAKATYVLAHRAVWSDLAALSVVHMVKVRAGNLPPPPCQSATYPSDAERTATLPTACQITH